MMQALREDFRKRALHAAPSIFQRCSGFQSVMSLLPIECPEVFVHDTRCEYRHPVEWLNQRQAT